MILAFNGTTSEKELRLWVNKVRQKKRKIKKSKMSKFFGILPDIGDGLKIQKKLRNEWD